MYAVDDLGDAIDVTRNFLTPVRPGMWLKLAVVVFFVSSLGLGGPTMPVGDFTMVSDEPVTNGDSLEDLETELESEFDGAVTIEDLLFVALVIGLVMLGLWLVFAFIAAVMEFVFIESLRTGEVHVRRYFAAYVGPGLRLFLFRLGVVLLAGVLVGSPVLLTVSSVGLAFDQLTLALVLLYALFAIAIGFVFAIAMRFTAEFVAPIMLLEERGVLGAWRRFWGTLTAAPSEYAVYLLLVWIIQLVVALAASFVIVIGALVVFVPVAIVVWLLFVSLGDIGVALGALTIFAGLLLVMLVAALLWVPITTYFRYYALLLLGDTDGTLDLIPNQRRAVRADGGNGPGGAAGSSDAWGGDGGDGAGGAGGSTDRSLEERRSTDERVADDLERSDTDSRDWETSDWDAPSDRDDSTGADDEDGPATDEDDRDGRW